MNKKGLKISKHPSIWNQDFRWTTTLNGASTSSAPKLVPTINSTKPPKRIIDKLIESDNDDDDDEKLPTESQNDDLMLNQYISVSEPSRKRFKDHTENDDQSNEAQENVQNGIVCSQSTSKQITPNRNPFRKSDSCTDILLSPTRISKENNSLVKTQSPVKMKQFDYGRLEKCSKFGKRGRTTVPKEERVVSRFFTPSKKDVEKTAVTKSDSGIQEDLSTKNEDNINVNTDPSAQMKSPNLLGTCLVTPNPALYFTRSMESPIQSEKSSENMSAANNVDDELYYGGENHRTILEQFKFVLKEGIDDIEQNSNGLANSQGASDKTDSETNELPIVLSDNDSEMDCSGDVAGKESSNPNWLSSSQKYKGVSSNCFIYLNKNYKSRFISRAHSKRKQPFNEKNQHQAATNRPPKQAQMRHKDV